MQNKFVTAALLSASFVSVSALAAESLDPRITPALRLGLSFGGPSQKEVLSLGLQFQYRGVYALRRSDLEAERFEIAPLSLEPVKLKADRSGLRAALVFSHDLLEDRRLAQNGGGSGSSWVWWTLGGIAVTAGALLAAGGATEDAIEDNSGGSGGSGGDEGGDGGGCTIVGGTYNPPDDIRPVLVSGCAPAPDVP
jgi:hypothetical protein